MKILPVFGKVKMKCMSGGGFLVPARHCQLLKFGNPCIYQIIFLHLLPIGMEQPLKHNKITVGRRRFISNTVNLAVAGSLIGLEQACKNKSANTGTTETATAKNKGKTKVPKKNTRHKWNYEKLVLNTKTNVIHLPTAAVYVYYDEIKQLQDVNLANWETQLQGQVHLNKGQSGNIIEILSLQKLRNEVSDATLSAAIDTLARAFTASCENVKGLNYNNSNYRLHELMLQLVALNNTIPPTSKWLVFNEKTERPVKLGKRQKWMENEINFIDRVNYIRDREADYKTRLVKRASKYSFT